jgi:hypothetical protein
MSASAGTTLAASGASCGPESRIGMKGMGRAARSSSPPTKSARATISSPCVEAPTPMLSGHAPPDAASLKTSRWNCCSNSRRCSCRRCSSA